MEKLALHIRLLQNIKLQQIVEKINVFDAEQDKVPLFKVAGLEINFLVYWSIVQCIQIFTGQNASCTGQVLEQLK